MSTARRAPRDLRTWLTAGGSKEEENEQPNDLKKRKQGAADNDEADKAGPAKRRVASAKQADDTKAQADDAAPAAAAPPAGKLTAAASKAVAAATAAAATLNSRPVAPPPKAEGPAAAAKTAAAAGTSSAQAANKDTTKTKKESERAAAAAAAAAAATAADSSEEEEEEGDGGSMSESSDEEDDFEVSLGPGDKYTDDGCGGISTSDELTWRKVSFGSFEQRRATIAWDDAVIARARKVLVGDARFRPTDAAFDEARADAYPGREHPEAPPDCFRECAEHLMGGGDARFRRLLRLNRRAARAAGKRPPRCVFDEELMCWWLTSLRGRRRRGGQRARGRGARPRERAPPMIRFHLESKYHSDGYAVLAFFKAQRRAVAIREQVEWCPLAKRRAVRVLRTLFGRPPGEAPPPPAARFDKARAARERACVEYLMRV